MLAARFDPPASRPHPLDARQIPTAADARIEGWAFESLLATAAQPSTANAVVLGKTKALSAKTSTRVAIIQPARPQTNAKEQEMGELQP